MTDVAAALATLRGFAPVSAAVVEAELARLTQERDEALVQEGKAWAEWNEMSKDLEAAYEAEAAAVTARDELQREMRRLRATGDDRE